MRARYAYRDFSKQHNIRHKHACRHALAHRQEHEAITYTRAHRHLTKTAMRTSSV